MKNVIGTLKKHKKHIMIGAGVLLALHVMRKTSTSSSLKQMPIGPSVEQLKAINGPLGSLE